MRKNSLTIAAVSLFLIAQLCSRGQLADAQTPTKAVVSAAFSKAAIRALLTIDRNSNKQLVDAAMVDLQAIGSTRAERSVTHEIEVFEEVHEIREKTRQSALEAGLYSEANEAHDGDHACIAAWLPKLRALRADIPKQCRE
jgi:hypothetical protein